jgi:hypothetical protein
MSFWQRQQVGAATRYLRWQYEKKGVPVPEEKELARQAAALVDQAQSIAQRTGKNVLGIIKDLINDFKK